MAIGSFKDLCEGFCEIAGVPAPTLGADEEGLIAFHVELRGVTINVVHAPATSTEHAFVLVECGVIPQKEARWVMQRLLDANFFSLHINPPAFSRNPVTGDAVLQFVYPFFEATPTGLFELISNGIELALRWREDFFLQDDAALDRPAAQQQSLTLGSFA